MSRAGAPRVARSVAQPVPGFAAGTVEAGLGMSAGIEQEAGASVKVGDGDDVPGVFGNDVHGENVDFAGCAGDDAGVGAESGVDVVEAVDDGADGFDLHAQDFALLVDDDPVVSDRCRLWVWKGGGRAGGRTRNRVSARSPMCLVLRFLRCPLARADRSSLGRRDVQIKTARAGKARAVSFFSYISRIANWIVKMGHGRANYFWNGMSKLGKKEELGA